MSFGAGGSEGALRRERMLAWGFEAAGRGKGGTVGVD